MAKKFITLAVQHKPQKLYTQDIRKVHRTAKRLLPLIPFFNTQDSETSNKPYYEETEESCMGEEENHT